MCILPSFPSHPVQLLLLVCIVLLSLVHASNSNNDVCGYAYIGNMQCGVVNQVTSVDITLYPPAETLYEVTTVWADSRDSGQIDSFVNYYTDISEEKTVTISVMFSEPDTQNVTITVRGYNDNYNVNSNDDDEDYSPCYETKKPPNSGDVWAVTVAYDDCYAKEAFSSSSSYGSIKNAYNASNVGTRFFSSNFVLAVLLCIVAGIGFVLYILRTNELQARTIQLNDPHDADDVDATMQRPSLFRHATTTTSTKSVTSNVNSNYARTNFV